MNVEMLIKNYSLFKEKSITDRLTTYEDILCLLNSLKCDVEKIGKSELGRDIHCITIGKGEKKLLFWSQMHGNEPTATSAIFDIVNCLTSENELFKDLITDVLSQFTLKFIPMLNPDGAMMWRRENANGIDLNRDAIDLKAKESIILRRVRDTFHPDFCFNLHDQRNIFNVKDTGKPATISFLSPSQDENRTITPTRVRAMNIILAMYKAVSEVLEGHASRFTDEFYPNATGDNFQKDGFSTILIESGAYLEDSERQTARFVNFAAILTIFECIMTGNMEKNIVSEYEKIPLNDTKMCDVLYKNVKFEEGIFDLALLYDEKPAKDRGSMIKNLIVYKIGNISEYFGIKTINANGKTVECLGKTLPVIGEVINSK